VVFHDLVDLYRTAPDRDTECAGCDSWAESATAGEAQRRAAEEHGGHGEVVRNDSFFDRQLQA